MSTCAETGIDHTLEGVQAWEATTPSESFSVYVIELDDAVCRRTACARTLRFLMRSTSIRRRRSSRSAGLSSTSRACARHIRGPTRSSRKTRMRRFVSFI